MNIRDDDGAIPDCRRYTPYGFGAHISDGKEVLCREM